jgi:hypothetical protein
VQKMKLVSDISDSLFQIVLFSKSNITTVRNSCCSTVILSVSNWFLQIVLHAVECDGN